MVKARRGQCVRRGQVRIARLWALAGARLHPGHAHLGRLLSQPRGSLFLQQNPVGLAGWPVAAQQCSRAFLGPRASPSRPVPAASKRDCLERFGPQTLERITRDDQVVCSTGYSRIVPLENGEVGPGAARGPVPARVMGRTPPPPRPGLTHGPVCRSWYPW